MVGVSDLRVEVLRSADDIDGHEWDALVERTGSPFFCTYAWLRAYQDGAPEDIAAHRYFLLRDGSGALAAGLPAYLVVSSPFWGGYAIESGFSDPAFTLPMMVTPCWYAFHSVLPTVLATERALPPLLDALEGEARACDAPVLAFPTVPQGHPLLGALTGRGFGAACIDAGHARPPAAARAEDELAAWLDSLKSDVRRDLLRRVRRSQEAGARFFLDFEPALIDPFVALTDATCVKHGIRPLYTAALLRSLARHAGESLVFPRLEAEGRLLGGFLGFRHGDALYLWCGGIDPASLSRFSTYVAILYHTFAWALAAGCRTIDMGRGNHEFKMKHGLRPLRLHLCLKALDDGRAGGLAGFLRRLEDGLAVPAALERLELHYGTFATTFYPPRPDPGKPY